MSGQLGGYVKFARIATIILVFVGACRRSMEFDGWRGYPSETIRKEQCQSAAPTDQRGPVHDLKGDVEKLRDPAAEGD